MIATYNYFFPKNRQLDKNIIKYYKIKENQKKRKYIKSNSLDDFYICQKNLNIILIETKN